MLHSIPKRIHIQHPVLIPETEQMNSAKILWPNRGVMVFGVISFLFAISIGIWRIAVTRGFNLPPIPEAWPAMACISQISSMGKTTNYWQLLV